MVGGKALLPLVPTCALAHNSSDDDAIEWMAVSVLLLAYFASVAYAYRRCRPHVPAVVFVLCLFFPPLLLIVLVWFLALASREDGVVAHCASSTQQKKSKARPTACAA